MSSKKRKKINLHLTPVSAKNDRQKAVLRSKKNLVLMGAAGTGKTFLASYMGFQAVMNEEYNRVVYFRSAVPTRDIGFLPGTEKEKMEVYKKPYKGICTELFDNGTAFEELEFKGKVKFEATSFARGMTLRDSFVIVDECQNMTFQELDTLITRLGENSRIIFCGDIEQADLPKNGFGSFYGILRTMEEFQSVNFQIEDIVRSELVKSYLTQKQRYYSG